MMRKINFLLSFLLILLLSNCRSEDLSEKDNLPVLPGKFTSRKILPSEFQKINGLDEKFGKSEKFLAQKLSTGKNIMDGAIIDSAYALETTDGNIISYTFPVYRSNQKGYFENLVLQKKVGEHNFKSLLYRYQRIGASKYNKQNIEVYNLDTITSSVVGKIKYTTVSSATGCFEFQTTSADCGYAGHHTNGQYCPQSGSYMPYDYVTVFDNCPPSGGGGGGGSSTPGNNNPSPGGGGGNYGATTPVPNYPRWGICSERTGAHWDAFGLNSSQLAFINAYAQNALRGEMVMFLGNNEVFTFDCNAPRDISPDVKSVGLWIINYAMTNPDFLNSEFWADFLNSDLQFQQFAVNFFNQNSNATWQQFEKWFIKKQLNYQNSSDVEFAGNLSALSHDLLLANQNNTLNQLQANWPNWEKIKQNIKNSIAQGIHQTAKIVKTYYDEVSKNPYYNNAATRVVLNMYIDALRNEIKQTTNMNKDTMNWQDLFNIWLFELMPNPYSNINFTWNSNVINGNTLYNSNTNAVYTFPKGEPDMMNDIKNGLNNGSFNVGDSMTKYFHYNFTQYYATLSNQNIGIQMLGSYPTKATVISKSGNSAIVRFYIYNVLGWDSATRFVQTSNGTIGIIPNKEIGEGLHLGGNLINTYTWEEVIVF